jgi:hypothetical protein
MGGEAGQSSDGDRTGGQAFFGSSHGEGADGNASLNIWGNSGIVYVKEYSDPSLVSGGSLVPTGVVNPYAGATAPAGWLLCFGQAISRTVYSTLFTAIGTTYGVGDGSTTFALPDMRGRAVAGQDDMGGTSANRLTFPASLGINGDILGAVGGNETPPSTSVGAGGFQSANHAMLHSGSANGWQMTGGALQPTIILNYIIKT